MELTVSWLFTAFMGTPMIISGWDISWIHFFLLITFLGFYYDISHQFFNLGSVLLVRTTVGAYWVTRDS